MVSIELTQEQILGILAFAYMGLTHNYESAETEEMKKDRQLLYMTSVVTLQGMSDEAYRSAIDKLEELRQYITAKSDE